MSSYDSKAVNPATGKEEKCIMWDDHFGRHHYGVYFYGDRFVYDAEDMSRKKDLTERQFNNLNQ
jgi:hypothetical protein